MPITEMREEKQRLITAALAQFEALKATGQLGSSFDRWMEPGLNNARLAGVATYRELIPGFQAMLKQCHGDLECFYARVRVLSKLPKDERLSQLRAASQPTLAMHYENGV
jgi:predicted aminopeptidase